MSRFIEVASVIEFADNEMRVIDVDGREMLIARSGEEFYAADNRCPHLGGRLSKGALEGSVVTCSLHHSSFDLRDGHFIQWTDWKGPAAAIAELARHPRGLRTYEVMVVDGKVLVGPEKRPAPTKSETAS